MDFITTKFFYRFTQVVSLFFLPLIILSLFFIRIEDRITVTGVIESDNQVVLRSPLDDTLLAEILVKPGTDVKEGEPLVKFQDLRNWRLELEKKIKRLELIQEKSDIYIKLRGEGAQSGLTTKDVMNEAETLKIEIKALQDDVDRLTLRAPFTGRITELMVKPYAKMEIGTPIVALSAMSQMDLKVVSCNVPQSRYPYLRTDQPVAIKSAQFPYLRFKIYTGVVKWFSKYASTTDQGQVYETKIALTGEAKDLLPIGSTATCEILVEDQPLYVLLTGENRR